MVAITRSRFKGKDGTFVGPDNGHAFDSIQRASLTAEVAQLISAAKPSGDLTAATAQLMPYLPFQIQDPKDTTWLYGRSKRLPVIFFKLSKMCCCRNLQFSGSLSSISL